MRRLRLVPLVAGLIALPILRVDPGAVGWDGLLTRGAAAPGIVRADGPSLAAGSFTTGQAADLMLSGYGFNRTGGSLRFNHPGGVAIVGGNLVMADRNNNRVLIWRGLPGPGDPPSVVLGQDGFETNAPGEGLDGLNWPGAVTTDGSRLYVADAYNDRVLVWRSLPTRNRQPADFALTSASGVGWPWGLWTDGRSLAVSATAGGKVLVWRSQPDAERSPDLELKIPEFGTPRSIGSDGVRLIVSDHNARIAGRDGPGNFFWTAFPAAAAQAYDFFMASPTVAGAGASAQGEHFHGLTFLPDGRLLALANNSLCIWTAFPRGSSEPCSVRLGGGGPGNTSSLRMDAGDNSGLAVDGERLVLSLNNGNRAIVFRSLPVSSGQLPDYAIGSPDIHTNTLDSDGIITNPAPLTDGNRLYVASDYDRRLHVWRSLPSESGRKADHVYDLDFGPWALARVGNGVAAAGQGALAIWTSPPDGQPPDVLLRNAIGGASLASLRGVAWDGVHLSLAAYDANRVYVWRGIPSSGAAPAAQLEVEQPGRISTDGRYLAVSTGGPGGAVLLYDATRLTQSPQPSRVQGSGYRMNLPQGLLLAEGGLYVADTNNNRVLVWRDAAAAAAGANPDAVLGATDLLPRKPWITQDRLFWPGALDFDGTRLWVGEFKFSNRILRYTAR